ncbi:MAG: hypothetical protein JXB10_15460 [Pirellulales bacterium]|nr:hypothetical protein [Pirellulales bacterium]
METPLSETAAVKIRLLLFSSDATVVALVGDCLALAAGRGAEAREEFQVTHAGTVRAALSQLAGQIFDLIVFDLGYASPIHFDILRQMADVAPRTAVLALAAERSPALSLHAVQSGAQELLTKKGLGGEELREGIRLAMTRKRAEIVVCNRMLRRQPSASGRERRIAGIPDRPMETAARPGREEDFLYMVAHDLKQPLLGIRNSGEMLLEDCGEQLGAKDRGRLRDLCGLCDGLLQRVDDLKTICCIDRETHWQTAVDLNVVLGDVLRLLQPAIQRRRAEVQVAHDLPCVPGNATLLGMVLSNLIVNAVKFNDCPQPKVEIGVLVADSPTLYVKDNGIGIAERHFREIFTLFRRLHPGTEYEGSGAGLAIVRKILDVHGGRIWLDSTPGVGTTFYFSLPAVEDAAAPAIRAPHWTEHTGVFGVVQE